MVLLLYLKLPYTDYMQASHKRHGDSSHALEEDASNVVGHGPIPMGAVGAT